MPGVPAMNEKSTYSLSSIPKPFIAFALLALVSLALAGCDSRAQEEAQPERPVLTIKVQYEPQTPDRSFVGTIKPRIENDVGFRVSGKVAKRLVEVGQVVEVGQSLALLDEADLKLQAEQADAELTAATGVLVQADASERRAVELRAKGWTTDVQLDQARAAAAEARGRVTRAERSVELTRNNLSYATLNADARGVVTFTAADPGQVVAAGQGVVRIARFAEKEVVIAVPETLVARAQGAGARVSLWSDPNKTYTAKLRELAPAADAATRTYLAKFSIPDATNEVKLGMTATLTLSDPSTLRVARVPLSAIYNQGEGPAVFVTDDKGYVELKPVTVTGYETRDAIISGGVDEGANVVAIGVHKLDVGQKVRIVSSLSF
jgi:RND family efflux transporter MFP subunit